MPLNKLLHKLAKPIAQIILRDVKVPRVYKSAIRQTDTKISKVLFICEDYLYLTPKLEELFMLLQQNWNADIRFLGLGRKDGGGWKAFERRTMDAAAEIASAKWLVYEDAPDMLSRVHLHLGTNTVSLAENGDINLVCSDLANAARFMPKAPIEKRLAQEDNPPDISVIIPAHNAEDTLDRAINSIFDQDYPIDRIELIIVDDGSTDHTRQIATTAAAQYPDSVRVLHIDTASGSPAAPRNIGLETSRGEYVLFLDADDWLDTQAVRRALGHALDWNSDVMLLKLIGEGGRKVPESMFFGSQPAADPASSKIMWTLAPLKLFRKSTIKDIRFPEDCMPEDIEFVLRAYAAAKTISVAADCDYYHVAAERGATNASITSWDDVESNLVAYANIFGFLDSEKPSFARCDALMRRLFGRDVVNTLRTIDASQDQDAKARHLVRLREIVEPFYNKKQLETLPKDARELLDCALSQ